MSLGKTPAAGEERGYAMVALLVLMAVMAVALTAALPAWSTLARREREAELVFRGEQYARAIALFQRKYAGAFPPTIDVLVNERFLRRKYKDPITDDDFQTIGVGQAVQGPQATNPFAPGQPGSAAPGRAGTAPAAATRQNGAGATPTQTGPRVGGSATGAVTTGQTQGGRGLSATGVGGLGASAGIMGVTSKSDQASLRIYKGADHYNQWLFIATQASTQAGGRGAQTPGQGVRGGAPPGTPGAPGGRGGRPTLPASPFGPGSPFGGRGQQPPVGPGPAGPGRGR